jgi:outer membrane protein OmpA-like peptidoglycan-associated protein
VIKIPATKIAALALLVGSMIVAPLLDDSDVHSSPENGPIPAQSPQFRIQRQEGELALSGHTLSLRHEQALLEVAELSYPGSLVSVDFQALGIVPDHWSDSTEEVVKLLAESTSGEVILSPDEIKIRAVVFNELAWQDRLERLRAAVPAELTISSETILVDPTVSVSDICERAFESFESGRINFEESSVEFRSSAYPRLDRLTALANVCSESLVLITGHTDASGSEIWNRALSVQRAGAVGDYLTRGGVSRQRLQISGVGSDEPVADDNTRFGRSLNRRIEIELSLND